MGTEAADIDDVLRESEALLNRLQSKRSSFEGNSDIFDAGASIASLGSVSLRDAASVLASVTDSTGWDPGSRVIDTLPVGKGAPPPQLGAEPLKIEQPQAGSVALAASVPRPPPRWEKVASAAAGDDDYVPLVDYTKEKPKHTVPTIRVATSRVSRLEAYRERARRMRRRRRVVAFVVAVVLAFVLGTWVKRAYLSRDYQGQTDHSRTTNLSDNRMDGNFTDAEPNDSSLENKSGGFPRIDATAPESCPIHINTKTPEVEEVSRLLQSENELLGTEIYDDGNECQLVLSSPDNPTVSVVQKGDMSKCKNPLVRLFSKRCRTMFRHGNKLSVEVAA